MRYKTKNDIHIVQNIGRFEGSLQAMEGILSIRKDTKYESKENGVAQYTFNCESKYKTKLPYSVIIYKDVGRIHHQYCDYNNNHLCHQLHLSQYQSYILRAMFQKLGFKSASYQTEHLKMPRAS